MCGIMNVVDVACCKHVLLDVRDLVVGGGMCKSGNCLFFVFSSRAALDSIEIQ